MAIGVQRWWSIVLVCSLLAGPVVAQQKSRPAQAPAASRQESKPPKKKGGDSAAAAKKRADSLRAIMDKLGVGAGATVADVGAGNGRDSWVFAEVVGPDGCVYAEEIADGKVSTIRQEAEKRQLSQVKPILGKGDDPCLPEAAADMAFMHYVYHHFSQPRPMLQGLWRALKPGGYLVIVDRRLGTLQDWVARETRAEKHFWIAETTVVREAREEGFEFACYAEDCWPADDQFVLVFRRPEQGDKPNADPDAPQPLDMTAAAKALLPTERNIERPVFIALGEARGLLSAIQARASTPGIDVVLEEWATQKEERPPLPEGVELPVSLTEKGDVSLGDEPVDTVYFLDTYHLLFHAKTLLAKLRESLTDDGEVVILDRAAERGISRREASHRRRISPDMVKEEMTAAGFELQAEPPAPAKDRFVLVFTKASQ